MGGEGQPIGRLEWVGPCSHHYHHYTKDFWIMDITRYVVQWCMCRPSETLNKDQKWRIRGRKINVKSCGSMDITQRCWQEFEHLIWADWTVGCYLYWHGTMWRINQTIPVYFCCWCWQTLVLTDWLHNDWGQWGGPGDKFLHFHTMEEWRGGGGVFVRCCYNTSYWIIVCLLVFYWPELSSSGAW